jgi:hypothetical protein
MNQKFTPNNGLINNKTAKIAKATKQGKIVRRIKSTVLFL